MTLSEKRNAVELTTHHSLGSTPADARRRVTDVSRPGVGFVQGTRPRFADETASLLRTRLQAAAIVVSVLLLVAFIGICSPKRSP